MYLSDKFINKVVYFCIIISLNLAFIDHKYGYAPLLLMSLIGILNIRSVFQKKQTILFYLPLLVALSWFYGVALGLLNGVEKKHVFQNFTGLLFYLSFYGLVAAKISIENIISSILLSCKIALIYGIFVFLNAVLSGNLSFSSVVSLSDLRILYVPAFFYLAPFIGICACHLMCGSCIDLRIFDTQLPKWIGGPTFFLLASLVFLFISMSKSFFAIYGLLIIMSIIFFIKNISKVSINRVIFISLFISVVIMLVCSTDILNILVFSFSNRESSNSVRAEQFGYILSEWTLFGSGLGASLASGYVRATEYPYGFELTFLNIIHKLGIASSPLFLAFLIPAWASAKKFCFSSANTLSWMFILTLLSYLAIAYANPVLLATNFVMLHCLVMYLYILYRESANEIF